MKYLVTARPGPMPPPIDQVRQARDWLQARLDDGTFDACYAFPGGGGFSISSADSADELMDMLLEYPMSPFVEYDVQPLVEMNDAFDRLIPFIEKMSAQFAGAAS